MESKNLFDYWLLYVISRFWSDSVTISHSYKRAEAVFFRKLFVLILQLQSIDAGLITFKLLLIAILQEITQSKSSSSIEIKCFVQFIRKINCIIVILKIEVNQVSKSINKHDLMLCYVYVCDESIKSIALNNENRQTENYW